MSGTDWTLTPNYGLFKPIPDADDDLWGDHWNDNADVLDTELFNVAQSLGNYLPLSGGALTGPVSTTSTFTFGGTVNNQPAKIGAGDGGVSYLALGAIGQNISWCVSAGVPYIFQNGVAVGGVVTTSSLSGQLGNYLPLAGGQMSGPLISSLGSSPTSPGIGIGDNGTGFRRSGANTLLAVGGGDTMQFGPTSTQALQPFLLSADATQPLQAVTYQQLMANAGAVAISDTPPATPRVGELWWNSSSTDPVGGQLFLYYQDPTSSQWVIANSGGVADAPTDGHLYARSNSNWSDITAGNAASPNNTGRNLIHNPLFNVQQRGAGPWTATNNYTADRWAIALTTDANSATVQSLADADRTAIGDEAARFALQDVFTGSASAGAFSAIWHGIEGIRRLSGKAVTFSFWARATSGTPSVGLALQQLFGSGGSPSAAVITSFGRTAALSATWQRYILTGTVPSAAGKTFGTNANDWTQVILVLSDAGNATFNTGVSQQSGTIQIYGVQLEIGSVATPLARRDPADDLALCQRFYFTGTASLGGYTGAGTGNQVVLAFPVTMRASPTITPSFSTQANCGSSAVNPWGNWGYQPYTVGTAAGNYQLTGNFTASADL